MATKVARAGMMRSATPTRAKAAMVTARTMRLRAVATENAVFWKTLTGALIFQSGSPRASASSGARHAVAVANKSFALLVPKAEGKRLEARNEGQRLDRLKEGMTFVASLEVVVRNARTEVVNMMVADVAREPLEDARQFIERTALQCGSGEIPVLPALPIDTIELMLNIEQPDARGSGDVQDGQLDDEIGGEAEKDGAKRNHAE